MTTMLQDIAQYALVFIQVLWPSKFYLGPLFIDSVALDDHVEDSNR